MVHVQACRYLSRERNNHGRRSWVVDTRCDGREGSTVPYRRHTLPKEKNPKKPFGDCYKEILNLIPKRINSIIFVADLDAPVVAHIRKRAHAESVTPGAVAKSVLATYLGSENVKDALIKNDAYIKIALTDQGRKNLDDAVRKEDVSLSVIVNHLFVKEGFRG